MVIGVLLFTTVSDQKVRAGLHTALTASQDHLGCVVDCWLRAGTGGQSSQAGLLSATKLYNRTLYH